MYIYLKLYLIFRKSCHSLALLHMCAVFNVTCSASFGVFVKLVLQAFGSVDAAQKVQQACSTS